MVKVVNVIPQSLSGETRQDSEPNIAVNPANHAQIAITAFTPDAMGGSHAPIFVPTDSGANWVLNTIVPSQNTTTGTATSRRASRQPILRRTRLKLAECPLG